MNALRLACILAIAGGGCWVLRFLFTPDSGFLFWLGALLLTGMGALLALGSVAKAPLWLRVVVGICGPLLGWMLLLAAHGPEDSSEAGRAAVDGVVGALSIARAVSAWAARITWSKRSGSSSPARIVTPSSSRSMRCTGVDRRTRSRKGAISAWT